jgi:hypothetical protein
MDCNSAVAPNTDSCEKQITRTDCYGCGILCTAAQICSTATLACAVAPPPSFATGALLPVVPWFGPGNVPFKLQLTPVAATNVTYWCRTGPVAAINGIPVVDSIPYTPCDGGTGVNPVHTPTPPGGVAELQGGTYRTDYHYRTDGYISTPVSKTYYIHHGVDLDVECAQGALAMNMETAYFTVARNWGVANPGKFSTAFTFSGQILANPSIKIPFVGVQKTWGMYWGTYGTPFTPGWPWIPALPGTGNFTTDDLSVHHRFVRSADGTMIARVRMYARTTWQGAHNCMDTVLFGSHHNSLMPRHYHDCTAFVVNSAGIGLCLSGSPAVVVDRSVTGYVKMGHRLDPGFSGYPSIPDLRSSKCTSDPTCNDYGGDTNPWFRLYLPP